MGTVLYYCVLSTVQYWLLVQGLWFNVCILIVGMEFWKDFEHFLLAYDLLELHQEEFCKNIERVIFKNFLKACGHFSMYVTNIILLRTQLFY